MQVQLSPINHATINCHNNNFAYITQPYYQSQLLSLNFRPVSEKLLVLHLLFNVCPDSISSCFVTTDIVTPLILCPQETLWEWVSA